MRHRDRSRVQSLNFSDHFYYTNNGITKIVEFQISTEKNLSVQIIFQLGEKDTPGSDKKSQYK